MKNLNNMRRHRAYSKRHANDFTNVLVPIFSEPWILSVKIDIAKQIEFKHFEVHKK